MKVFLSFPKRHYYHYPANAGFSMDARNLFLYFYNIMQADEMILHVRLGVGAKTYCAPDWHWHRLPNTRTGVCLWTVFGGRGQLTVRGRTFPLAAGDCFFTLSREECLGEQDPERPLVVIWLYLDRLDESGQARELDLAEAPPLHRRLENPQFIQEVLERVVAAFAAGERAQELADHWMRGALLEIAAQDRRRAPAGPFADQAARINELCRQIREAPAQKWTVPALARELHCTPQHFSRLFRALKGQSPGEFVIASRLAAARALLHNSSHPIGRIAQLLGYRDVYFFCKQFSRHHSQSPSAFRRSGA